MESSGDTGGDDSGSNNGVECGVIVVGPCECMSGGFDGRIWVVPKY